MKFSNMFELNNVHVCKYHELMKLTQAKLTENRKNYRTEMARNELLGDVHRFDKIQPRPQLLQCFKTFIWLFSRRQDDLFIDE